MKRRDLVRHLLDNNCILMREGAKHSIFYNLTTKQTSSMPRHIEIDLFLAKKICLDLNIAPPIKK